MIHPLQNPGSRSVVGAFLEHIDAFNAHDTDRLLAGFADDARWMTGADSFRGKAELAGLFDAGLWSLQPTLMTVNTVVGTDQVATELREHLMVGGQPHEFHIAVFLQISGGLIRTAKVYREGSADVPSA